MKNLIKFILSLFKVNKKLPTKTYTIKSRNPDVFESKVLALINEYRKPINLPELEMNKIVCNVCFKNNERMILTNNFSHDGAVERFNEVMAICDSYYAAENLAKNYNTAESVVNAWIKSDTHRKNLECAKCNSFGISVTKDSSNINYYTTMFTIID